MKILFVGSSIRITIIEKLVESLFTFIEAFYIKTDETEFNQKTAEQMNYYKECIDGCLFGGELHYQFYNSIFSSQIPCNYIRKDWSSLQTAFLKITLQEIDFRQVSIDSYSFSSIQKVLNDLGISLKTNTIKIIKRRKFDSAYIETVFREHLFLYKNKQIKGCITALQPVYYSLREKKIPCVYIQPTSEIINKSINNLLEECTKRSSCNACIAMLELRIIPKKEYSYIRHDDYLYMHEKLKVADEVFYFVKNTKAAVICESFDRFLILMNRKTLTQYTNGLQQFFLIDSIHNNTNCDVNIGIGYGFNPSEAKQNAITACEKLDENCKNIIYIVPHENAVLGPFNFLTNTISEKSQTEEKYFTTVSEITGISQVLLYKLYTVIEKEKKSTFMMSELGRKLHLSQRNSSRLMQKLEKNRLAKFIGKQLTGKSGRPKDIFEIKIDPKKKL